MVGLALQFHRTGKAQALGVRGSFAAMREEKEEWQAKEYVKLWKQFSKVKS